MTTLDISVDDFWASPLGYPGSAPGRSVLLVDRTCMELRPRAGRQLGQAGVRDEDGTVGTLEAALLAASAAPVDQRTVVVSIGSNSSLAVMRRKFAAARVSTTFALLKGTLGGVGLGHSAHVSLPGYIAAAPFAMDGARSEVYAALLDAEQVRCLDRTEPNYERRLLSGCGFDLALDLDEGPEEFWLYVSRHGVIARPRDVPVPLALQSRLLELLSSECAPFGSLFNGMEPEAVAHKLAGAAALRDEVRRMLADHSWCRSSGIGPR